MSAQAMLAKRRALEDQTYHNTLKLKEDFKLSALADWEVKTTKTIQRKQIELRAKQLAKEEVRENNQHTRTLPCSSSNPPPLTLNKGRRPRFPPLRPKIPLLLRDVLLEDRPREPSRDPLRAQGAHPRPRAPPEIPARERKATVRQEHV